MSHPTVYFLRHGQTDWNVAYRLQGQMDIPINETGRTQARKNGRKLADLVSNPKDFRFVASPLGRTRETMNLVRDELGLPPHDYDTDDRLKEISFGLWETHTFDELRKTVPDLVDQRFHEKWSFRPPQGESYAMLMARVESWLPYVTQNSIVVCHGGVLRVLDHLINGTPPDQVVQQSVPQDRIWKWNGHSADWI